MLIIDQPRIRGDWDAGETRDLMESGPILRSRHGKMQQGTMMVGREEKSGSDQPGSSTSSE